MRSFIGRENQENHEPRTSRQRRSLGAHGTRFRKARGRSNGTGDAVNGYSDYCPHGGPGKCECSMCFESAILAERAELRKLERPEAAAERYYDIGWWHGTTAVRTMHPHHAIGMVPSTGELRDFRYQPPATVRE